MLIAVTIIRLPGEKEEAGSDVDKEELEPLLEELDALAETRFGADAEGCATAIRDAEGESVDIGALPFTHSLALLRALDHLHNAGTLGPELARARGALTEPGIDYIIRDTLTGEEREWVSYSGPYEDGDRIVSDSDGPAVVLQRMRGFEPPLLLCQK